MTDLSLTQRKAVPLKSTKTTNRNQKKQIQENANKKKVAEGCILVRPLWFTTNPDQRTPLPQTSLVDPDGQLIR